MRAHTHTHSEAQVPAATADPEAQGVGNGAPVRSLRGALPRAREAGPPGGATCPCHEHMHPGVRQGVREAAASPQLSPPGRNALHALGGSLRAPGLASDPASTVPPGGHTWATMSM